MPYITVNDAALYYEIDGSGPPLLMVMGLGGNAQVWAPIRRRLARHWRLVLYDMQGTGRSAAPERPATVDDLAAEIEALRRHLQLDRFRAIGYSFGAAVLLSYARRHAEALHSVSLISGLYEVGPFAHSFFRVQSDLAQSLSRTDYLKQIALWLLSESFFERQPEFLDRVVAMLARSPQAGQAFDGWTRFSGAFKASYREELEALRCPVQIVHGGHDKVSPVSAAGRHAAAVAGCQFSVVEDAGHMLPWDAPQATAERVVKFFSEN